MSLNAPMMIPEILELMFLHLDQTTLTSCLGVCRMWNRLITSSQKVLQRMYLRPYVPTAAELSPRPVRCRWSESWGGYTPELKKYRRTLSVFGKDNKLNISPLLNWAFPGWLNDPFNPAIPPAFDYPSTELRWKHWQSTIAYQVFPMIPWTRNPAAWQRKEASWRRIEVSQPPIRKLVVEQVDKGRAEMWEEATLLFPAGDQGTRPGLLMGELYDHIEKRLQHPDQMVNHCAEFHIDIEVEKDSVDATMWLNFTIFSSREVVEPRPDRAMYRSHAAGQWQLSWDERSEIEKTPHYTWNHQGRIFE